MSRKLSLSNTYEELIARIRELNEHVIEAIRHGTIPVSDLLENHEDLTHFRSASERKVNAFVRHLDPTLCLIFPKFWYSLTDLMNGLGRVADAQSKNAEIPHNFSEVESQFWKLVFWTAKNLPGTLELSFGVDARIGPHVLERDCSWSDFRDAVAFTSDRDFVFTPKQVSSLFYNDIYQCSPEYKLIKGILSISDKHRICPRRRPCLH